MTATLLNGKELAEEIKAKIKEKIAALATKPGLAVVLVGDDVSSQIYIKNKQKACEEVGINSVKYHLPETTSEAALLELLNKLNVDDKIHGILVQLPLPSSINKNKVLDAILPEKDVDGIGGRMWKDVIDGNERCAPCTPKGIVKLLEKYNVPIAGKQVCIINRSNIVGKPLLLMLLNRDATVTVCHSKTQELHKHILEADILISAVGRPHFITASMVKEGVVVVDVGISRVNGKIVGDVDFEGVKEKASYITPMPGGVGPMTVAILLENTYEAAKAREIKS